MVLSSLVVSVFLFIHRPLLLPSPTPPPANTQRKILFPITNINTSQQLFLNPSFSTYFQSLVLLQSLSLLIHSQ